jgi:acyl dehydratase
MSVAALLPYTVNAYNSSRDSENKIHDDAVASRFGFRGGLVPGVDVYAYMTHLPVVRWGRAWLERGTATCRFLKPVYDGEDATVTANETANGVDLRVESGGALCATGLATMADAPPVAPALGDGSAPLPAATRVPADETSLAPGTLLGMKPLLVSAEVAARYLEDLRETEPLYARDGVIHPGLILRACNWALMHNVILGPWIHVASTIQHVAAARVGDEVSVRGRVTANYERKGHRFVELDAVVVSNARTPIAQITHTAIYRPRQVGA